MYITTKFDNNHPKQKLMLRLETGTSYPLPTIVRVCVHVRYVFKNIIYSPSKFCG